MDRTKEDRQSLFMKTDNNSGGWELGWVGLVFCLTTAKKEEIVKLSLRAPVAQMVEHQAAIREVVSSIPAGPTLRVFNTLRRKCCLCNYIRKWLRLSSPLG